MSLMSAEALTLSLPRYPLKTANKSAKFEILMSFSFFALARERIYIRTRSIERRFVTEPEKTCCLAGLCVHVSARKLLPAGAVKGLKHSALKRRRASLQDYAAKTRDCSGTCPR